MLYRRTADAFSCAVRRFDTVALASKLPGYRDVSQLTKAISPVLKLSELYAAASTGFPVTLNLL